MSALLSGAIAWCTVVFCFGEKDKNMSSNPRTTPPPEITAQHPHSIAEHELKYLKRCFATFPDVVLVGSGQGGGLNLAAEDLLGFSLSALESTLSRSQRKLT
jgi:hypothetical protein